MDKTETYLWGTLFALVREQLAAIDKQLAGELGFFGRARFSSRTREIEKFVFKLLKKKAEAHGDEAISYLAADLDVISETKGTWSDKKNEETTYVRNILASLVGP